MDRTRRPAFALRRALTLALALAAIASSTPGRAVVPYQGWTPSSFGFVPECGKYAIPAGYFVPGCLYTRRMKFHPSIPGFAIAGTLHSGPWLTTNGSTWIPLAPHCLTPTLVDGTVQNLDTTTRGAPLPCGIEDIAFDPLDSNTIYLSGFRLTNPTLRGPTFEPGGVYRSNDLGASWTNISKPVPNWPASALAVIHKPGEPATIMVGKFQHAEHDVGNDKSLAISYNDGATWTYAKFPKVKGCNPVIVTASKDLVASIVADPKNPNVVYSGTNGGLYRSANRGRSWAPVLTKCFSASKFNIGFVWAVAVSADGRTLYAGVWDGTIRVASTATPATWKTLITLDGDQISHILLDSRDPTGHSMFVATMHNQVGKPNQSAGIYRVRTSPVQSVLLSDSYMAGVNHQAGVVASLLPYNLVKNSPGYWLAQSPLDPDVLYVSQAAGGIFWRSEGAPAPVPSSTSQPAPTLPGVPTSQPTPAIPGVPAIPTRAPTAIPSPTITPTA